MTTTSSVEVWKDIPGFEGAYQASTLGRVRSVERRVEVKGKTATYTRSVAEKILKPGRKKDGHLSVCLKRYVSYQVHTLVMLTFVGPQPPKQDIRHLNGNPADNRLENLAYGSRTQNILDVYTTGRPWRTLTTEQVYEIRERLKNGEKLKPIAEDYSVQISCISAIRTGRLYGWLK